MKIAFFDSGIGGLTVLALARRQMPGHEYVYYADTDHVPYGTKPGADVRRYVFQAMDFLVERGAGAAVVACNTATSIAIREVRARYGLPVLGMEPAVKPAIQRNRGKDVLVMATALTLRESKLSTLIAALHCDDKIQRLEMGGLVNFAENFDFGSRQVMDYVRGQLARVDLSAIETVVLGCTHFIYYRDLIQDAAGPDIELIDGNAGTVNNLRTVAPDNGGAAVPPVTFYSSGRPETPERTARLRELLERV